MKVLLTGAGGQLGQSLQHIIGNNDSQIELVCISHGQLSITDESQINKALEREHPDIIVNCAAYTAVDKAEEEPEKANLINHLGAKIIATATAQKNIPLIHISTDYVFSGKQHGNNGYTEDSITEPLGVYGKTKLLGEQAVRRINPHHLILRTAWLFSPFGKNFVTTMLLLGQKQKTLRIVNDQFGSPTSALELARVIYLLIKNAPLNTSVNTPFPWGTYHVTQSPSANWYQVASTLFQGMSQIYQHKKYTTAPHIIVEHITPIPTNEFPTTAKRPINSILNCQKLKSTFGISMKPWEDSILEVLHYLHHSNTPSIGRQAGR